MKLNMFSQGTILVVESNETTAFLLDYLLSREGYRVVTASNNMQLDESLQYHPPQMIILNTHMSYEQGNRLISQCRSQAGWQEVPILLLSKEYSSHEIDSALSAGANDYIVQPFNHLELIGHIGRHMHSLQ